MDFELTSEQKLLVDSVSSFLKAECPPERQREWDENHEFPLEIWRKLGENGWLGLAIPEEYGGNRGSTMDIVLFGETLSYGMTGLSAAFQRSACYGGLTISQVGTDEQKEKYLPGLASGERMVAIALTEPEAGSDAASLRTTAVQDGDGWVLNGQKVYTSGADLADWIVVAARTDPDAKPRDGITTLIVPRDTPGIEIRPMAKLGNWTTTTCEVFFNDARVADDAVLGGVNQAWNTTLAEGLDMERISIGAHCTGSAQKAFDIALEYARSRKQFDRPIARFQMIQSKLVDMASLIESGRLITYYAAWRHDRGLRCRKEASMSKLVASEAWNRVAYDAMQVLGGSGYMMDNDVQRHYRDARLYTIGGGTSEIQRLIIAHELINSG